MKHKTLLALALSWSGMAWAQTSITPEVLQQLQGSYQATPTEKALRNAISNVGIQKMAVNQEHIANPDTHFSIEVKNSGISDQQSSGRCWLFTGTNVLRHKAMRTLGVQNFFFSQVYLFFYDQLEKSNLFLQGIIDTRKKPIDDQMVTWLFKNPLSDGGTYTGVADLVSKYGLVPKDVMPETYVSNSTSEFCGHLKRKLREAGILLREKSEAGASEKELQAFKVEQLKTVYRLLVMDGLRHPATGLHLGSHQGRQAPVGGKDLHAPVLLSGGVRSGGRPQCRLCDAHERPQPSLRKGL